MLQKNKGNAPWFNRTVKNKLIQRDHFKRKAIKTDDESDWKLSISHLERLQILPCEMLKGNIMQQNFSITKVTQTCVKSSK